MQKYYKLLAVLFVFVGVGCVGLKTSPYTYVGTWEEENFGTQIPLRNGRGYAKMSFYPDFRVEGYIEDSLFLNQYMVSGSWRNSMVNLLITRHQVHSIGDIRFTEDSSKVLVRYYNDNKMYRGIMTLTKKSIVDSLKRK